jgi:PKD repeat protein
VGNYTVSLTVAGPAGEDTETVKDYIRVGMEVKAAFSATPTTGPAPLTVVFTGESTGTVDSRLWDFGDGSESTERNPSHVYTKPGAYTVSLQTGPAGRDKQTRRITFGRDGCVSSRTQNVWRH